MISITNFREGAILNHRHGRESRDALTVTVEGVNSFGAPVRVGQLDMTWRTDDASAWSDGVKNLRLLGSNDGENFTPLASFEYDKHALAVTTVELVPPVAYRYYRIAAQDYGYLIIGELEFTYRR